MSRLQRSSLRRSVVSSALLSRWFLLFHSLEIIAYPSTGKSYFPAEALQERSNLHKLFTPRESGDLHSIDRFAGVAKRRIGLQLA